MFKKCRHIRLLKWVFYLLNWIICPVLPCVYLIVKFNLYTKISGGNKFQFLFIFLISICVFFVIKWLLSESKLRDAKSEGEYRMRFILEALFESIKYFIIIFFVCYIIKGYTTMNAGTVENIFTLIKAVLHVVGLKVIQIWVACFTIKPVELTIKFRQGAFIKNAIDEQSEFIK
nr:MAG TPA: hypothetical protein [Caudoviricetes sp.]